MSVRSRRQFSTSTSPPWAWGDDMTSPGQVTINKRLFDALRCCPSCSASICATGTAEDGMPFGVVFEILFDCGARVQVEDTGEYYVDTGCPADLQLILSELHESVIADLEAEFPPDGGAS